MTKLNDINEAISYLKEGEILTTNGKDQFVVKNSKIYRYQDGTSFFLELKDFKDLYKNTNFYLYEDLVLVDEDKDEAYYRYYKK